MEEEDAGHENPGITVEQIQQDIDKQMEVLNEVLPDSVTEQQAEFERPQRPAGAAADAATQSSADAVKQQQSSQAEVHSDITHEGAVRGIQFSSDGQYLLTCGDDKTARSWKAADWSCLRVLKSSKKACACAFSQDGSHAFFADRFGDVLVATTTPPAEADAAAAADAEEPNLLLGHLQAIITSLTSGLVSSSEQQLLVSTDRDGKVRASVLPGDPAKGSYEIHSYCLGHTNFVTCSAAVPAAAAVAAGSSSLLVTGGGDGTVRLWDADTGQQLASFVASEQPKQLEQEQQEESKQEQKQEAAANDAEQGDAAEAGDAAADAKAGDGDDGDSSSSDGDDDGAAGGDTADPQPFKGRPYQRQDCAAVLSVAVSPDGSVVAAAVEGQQEVQLLQVQQGVEGGAASLQLLQKLAFGDVANPATVAFDGRGRLWVVGGPLLLETESAHVAVAARETSGGEFSAVTDQVLPGSLRGFLERRVAAEEEGQAGQAVGSYYHEGFKRKVYTQDTLAERKKVRTDFREGERLKAMFAAQDKQQQPDNKQEQKAAQQ
ncbi:WD40-repeat-containing domain protein [Scenedesmus sp. NREL 46B-D3]|nr:WD40-repeat-containing domain protein [Scenedesmus sp. NREL 46B-D3]